MKKRILAIVLSGTMVLGSGLMANAATSATVTLYTSDYSKTSSVVGDASAVTVYAKNYSESKHKVKAITRGAIAGGSFTQLDSVTMDVGTTMNTKTVKGYSSSTSYCLSLNPTATYKNCYAYGSIKCN